MKQENNILTADEGMWLTNGNTYSQQVWLGVNDSVDNWNEVWEDDVPKEYLDSLFTEWSDEQKEKWEEEHPEGEEGEEN